MRSALRSYKEENWSKQLSRALQGKPRTDGAIAEFTVDKSSARAAVTGGPKSVKLKLFIVISRWAGEDSMLERV
jgi:hypothetical protein